VPEPYVSKQVFLSGIRRKPMKIALISTSLAVVLLAILATYALPAFEGRDIPEPYRFAQVR
jgi:hypothetical protein